MRHFSLSKGIVRCCLWTAVGLAAAPDRVLAADDAKGSKPFAALDADGDGAVSLGEAFPGEVRSADRKRYFLLDADGDGELNADEWKAQQEHRTAINLFRGFDADGDGEAAPAELLEGASEMRQQHLRQQLAALDADGNGGLSAVEFSWSPVLVPREARGDLADPIVSLAEEAIERITQAAAPPIAVEKWAEVAASHLRPPIPHAAEQWDRNADGAVDGAELRMGIELAYGVARDGGGRARFGDGRVFNEHFYRQLDRDGDRVFANDELGVLATRLKRTAEQIREIDANGDGRIDMAELDGAGLFQADTIGEFLRWDANRDGAATAKEFEAQSRSYDNAIAARMLPAFDLNKDERIDLAEFLRSPLADGSYFANDRREDQDHDGRLSAGEFFPSGRLPLSGLAAVYFDQYDRNGDGGLDLSEATFGISLDKMAPDIALKILDRDASGTVEVDEYVVAASGEGARRRYFLMDADADGRLSPAEWAQQGRGVTPKAVNIFRGYDADADDGVSLEELLVDASGSVVDSLRRKFVVFDFDRDERLSLAEFSIVPDLVPASERLAAPDAVVTLAGGRLAELSELLPPPVGRSAWEEKARSCLPAPIPLEFDLWDADSDGALSAAELQQGVEQAYGVARRGGGLSRFPDARVFNEHFYRQIDADGDRSLSLQELNRLAGQLKKTVEELQKLDLNEDERVVMAELDAAGLFQTDMVGRFYGWDHNRDGGIDATELVEQARGWEDHISPHVLPAFDGDGNGLLTLPEFLESPIADGSYFANEVREDRDHDGKLSLEEFFPDPTLAYSGLAANYFARLDLNRNELLDYREVEFQIDFRKAPPAVAFEMLDADGDERVSPREAFGVDDLAAVVDPMHARIYQDRDADGDGMLTAEELKSVGRLVAAVEAERVLRAEALPALQTLDTDSDGALTLEEWASGRESDDAAAVEKQFRGADSNADGRLTVRELAHIRGVVKSPLADDALVRHVEDLVHTVLTQAGEDRTTSGVAKALAPAAPQLPSARASAWDHDRDGRIHPDELCEGLEILFGLRAPDRAALRDQRGLRFNARWFATLDKNRDRSVARDEFTSSSRTPEELAASFTAADRNRDGRLTLGEGAAVEWMWTSPLSVFRRVDSNSDGKIVVDEFSGRLEPWEARIAAWTLPAFDTDGDGALSLEEFQLSPLAIPARTWDQPRVDADYDDRLSRAEFHADREEWNEGLSALFFSQLDADHDGSLARSEMEFTVDLKRAPLEIVFRLFDRGQDGKLSLQETLEGRGVKGSRGWTMQTEDAFYAADADHDGSLSATEFAAPGTTVGLLATGRPLPPRPRGGRRPAGAATAAAEEGGWDVKLVALVAFNVLLVGGLAWAVLRGSGRS